MRGITALIVGTVVIGTACQAFAGASGTFSYKGRTLKVADALAYEAKPEFGDATVVRVRLFGQPVDHKALAAALDLAHEVERQTEGAYAELVFSQSGAWQGSTYNLGGGVNCGWCSDGKAGAKSQAKLVAGSLQGTLAVKSVDYMDGKGPEIRLSLDVPVATVTGTTALPAGGGDPAKALAACRAAFKRRVIDEVKSVCFAADDPDMQLNISDEGFWITTRSSHGSLSLESLKVTGGRTRADWAELTILGKGEEGPKKGSVFLRRTPAGWRVDHEQLATPE